MHMRHFVSPFPDANILTSLLTHLIHQAEWGKISRGDKEEIVKQAPKTKP